MDFMTFIYVYFALTAGLLFVLLFGESPALSGTPVRWLHWLITSAWLEALEHVVQMVCGTWGRRHLDSIAECCCERPNPILQITYLSIFAVGYYLYWEHLFKVLPNSYASEWHIFTGTAMVCLCLTLFVVASLSDPGYITAENATMYARAYPNDAAIFPSKECTTCNISRPGRSKHCNVCGRCSARHDHHCGWINNCVGLHNMRTFLAFLAANFGLCVYGVLLGARILAGEMDRLGLFKVVLYNARTNQQMPLYKNPPRLMNWLIVYFPVPVALLMFLAIASLLTAGFLAYQCWLIIRGCTTYETYKWRQLERQLQKAAYAEAQRQRLAGEAVDKGGTSVVKGASAQLHPKQSQPRQQGHPDDTVCAPDAVELSEHQRAERRPATRLKQLFPGFSYVRPLHVAMPLNPYDKGWRHNFLEVLFPRRFLAQAQEEHARAMTQQQHLKSKAD